MAFTASDLFVERLMEWGFDYIEFLPKPGQAVCVQIDDRPERIGLRFPADVGLVGDARATLQALIPHLQRNDDRAFLERAKQGIREWWRLMEQRGTRTETPMKPQVVAWHLAQALADDAIVCGDSGAGHLLGAALPHVVSGGAARGDRGAGCRPLHTHPPPVRALDYG